MMRDMSFNLLIGGSILLISSLLPGQNKKLPSQIGPASTTVNGESPVARDCKQEDWSLLEAPEASGLLSDYDFDGFVPGECKAVDAPWLHSAQIVRLKAVSAEVDDIREITLLRASHESRLWLIPIEHGMVGYPGTPGDPNHLAAFNDLLRAARLKVTDDNLFEVSDLYQFVVGMEVMPNPRPPETLKNALSKSDLEGSVEHNDGFIDFTHREKFGDRWTRSYMVWEFRYSTSGGSARLVDVERKTLKEEGDGR